ncbi:MAG TPA: MBL fold metallo-hydrolase [Ardenticatenaceae bacterium]|nr:MBL fold metallo-hydrolase [Ardenticatenaceae bacterium]
MDIKWLGHSCFRVRDKAGIVVTDPFPRGLGYERPARLRADVVTVSHDHENHSDTRGFLGEPFIVRGPGEYEINGIFVTGIRTYHDNKKGKERGFNTIYLIQYDDLSVCHLGDLGHVPTQEQVEELSEVDVLLVPVGGGYALSAAQAAEVVSLIEPRLVVPMHYQTDVHVNGLEPVEKFLKEMGLKEAPVEEELKITKSQLPEETQVVVLAYGAG